MSKPILHLCDFDGTLTRGDSFVRFLWFAIPAPQLTIGAATLVLQFLHLFFSGQWSNARAKAAVLSMFFRGKTRVDMRALGEAFCREKLPGILRHELQEKLRQAIQNGDKVVLVSASPDLWLRPFSTAIGFDLLCTELEFESDKFMGQFATPNCNGAEKARRIQAAYTLSSFEKIIAYGNSSGDAAMFDLADEVFKF